MIIKHLLLRLICFLYIVLFVVPLIFLYYMDTTEDLCSLMIFPVVIVRFKFLFSVSSVLNVNPLMPCFQLILSLILSSLIFSFTISLDENDDLITSFEVALQTIRKVKARVIEFWDSLFPDWRDFKQDDLKIESLKRHNILFGSTRSYCKLCVLSPTGSQL